MGQKLAKAYDNSGQASWEAPSVSDQGPDSAPGGADKNPDSAPGGADKSPDSAPGGAALIAAIRSRDERAVAQILADDPSSATATENGVSAVLFAVYNGHIESARAIAAAKRDVDVFDAAAIGDADTIRKLVAQRPDVVLDYSSDGFTALHLGAFFGHPDVVETLLAAGADPGAVSRNEMRVTPLNSAAATSQTDVAAALIAAGSPIDAAQHGGWTPLHSAAHNGNIRLVRMLLDLGADPNAANESGTKAIDLAQERDHAEVAQLLARY